VLTVSLVVLRHFSIFFAVKIASGQPLVLLRTLPAHRESSSGFIHLPPSRVNSFMLTPVLSLLQFRLDHLYSTNALIMPTLPALGDPALY